VLIAHIPLTLIKLISLKFINIQVIVKYYQHRIANTTL
jgi:hypothetical protein